MYTPSVISRTVKFALAALFGITLALPARAADPYVWNLDGTEKDCSSSDFFNKGDNLVLTNGTWQVKSSGKIANLSYGSNFLPQFTIANDALLWADSIRILCSDSSKTGTMTMTVEKGGKIQLGGDNCYVNDGRKSQTDQLIIDGGEVWGNTPNFSIANPGQGGMGTEKIYGVLEIKNGGSLNISNATLGVSVRADSVSGAVSGKARGTLTVDGSSGGAKLVAKKIYVNPKATSKDAKNKLDNCHTYASSTVTFRNCEIETGDLYAYKYGAIAMTLDGATISTMSGITDTSFFTLNDKADDNETCVLGDGGVTFNIKDNYGAGAKLKFGFPASGTGFFKKTGPYNMTFSSTYTQTYTGATICEEGTLFIPTTIASTDLRAVGGTIDLTGVTLPDASTIDLTLAGENGKFVALDQSKTYKSLTLGEDAVLPVAFADSAVTTFKAGSIDVVATQDRPAVISISGLSAITENKVILENLTTTDVSLFKLEGIAGSLKIENGKLIAAKPSRPVDTLTWAKGSAGGDWTGVDNWTYGDSATATTFQTGDTALFATAGAQATVDADVTAATVEFGADATVTGSATLVTPNIIVVAGVKATISAPLGEDFAKSGSGTLVLGAANNVNVTSIKGTLDLGGNKQNADGSVFKDGSAVTNGTLNLNFDKTEWMKVNGVSFTIAKDATVQTLPENIDERAGELNILGGSVITIDGGTFIANNARTSNGNNIGNDSGSGMVRVINGGKFESPKIRVQVGAHTQKDSSEDVVGVLSVNDGEVIIGGTSGNESLIVGGSRAAQEGVATGIVAMTNGTLTAYSILLGADSSNKNGLDGNTAQLTFKDSTLNVKSIIKGKAITEKSYLVFDGATWNVEGNKTEILSDLGCEVRIDEGGLAIDTDHDVTIAASISGTGKLTKTGKGSLTLNGVQTNYTGNIEVAEGTFGFGSAVTFAAVEEPTRTLSVAGGATVDVGYSSKGGFAGTEHFLLKPTGEGKINLTITASTLPTAGKYYPLFAGTFDETITNRLEVMAGYALEVQDGKLVVSVAPRTVKWSGEDQDTDAWSSALNWGGEEPPVAVDTVKFDSEGDATTYDLENGLAFQLLDVASGAWTTKVDQASFANTPLALAQGASFALTGASGKTNPFSTAKDANAIAGVLDLGGATQTFIGTLADEKGFFRNGGEIRNVALTIDPAGWFRLHNVSFTIGTNAAVTVKKYTDSKGQLNLYDSYLKIDGGSLSVLNARDVGNAGAYIGNNGDATIEILNGGSFSHPNKRVILGFGSDGKGAGSLIGDRATVDLGNQTLNLGNRNGSASCLALTNSTLTCSTITLGFEGTPGKQTVELVNTTVNLGQFNKEKLGTNSSVVFDGATIVDNHGATALLQDLGIPYTIAEGGLTVNVSNRTADDDYVSFPGTFNGEGDFILVAAGKTPREARFSGEAEKGFTGNVVVGDKITVTASKKAFKGGLVAKKGSTVAIENSTFAGGLEAREGATLDVATSVFEGDITLEDGVAFATEGVTMKEHMTSGVLVAKTKGTIKLPEGALHDKTTRNGAYVIEKNGYSELYYGRKPGFVMLLK